MSVIDGGSASSSNSGFLDGGSPSSPNGEVVDGGGPVVDCTEARFYFGPVKADLLSGEAGWTSTAGEWGRSFAVSGQVLEPFGTQLSELFANRGMVQTVGPYLGHLEPFWTDFDHWRPFCGMVMWTSVDVSGPFLHGRLDTPIRTLSASGVLLPTDRLVVTRSERARTQACNITPVAMVAAPFYDTENASPDFVTGGGGRLTTRPYDPASWERLPAPSRKMAIRRGPGLARLLVPAVENNGPIPGWVAYRGGDVRCYDVARIAEVFGPGHPFDQPEHCGMTNGLIRFTCGPRGAQPYLAVDAHNESGWYPVGYVRLSLGTGTTLGARMEWRTPDDATVVVAARQSGDIRISLHRGQRSLWITHGSPSDPIQDRVVQWTDIQPLPLTSGWGFEPWGETPWGGSGTEPVDAFGSGLSGCMTYEATTDGGGTRVTDVNGFTRAVAVLSTGPARNGLGVISRARAMEAWAIVATLNDGDNLADHHSEAAMASEQTVRIF